jgi:hypothetical protein
MNNPHVGSSFDDVLIEVGIYDEVNAAAIKQVIAWQLEESRLSDSRERRDQKSDDPKQKAS